MIVKKCSKIKSMDNILPENEFVEIEGRQYLNPQTGLDESNAFIENLRATQGQQNQQIASDTYNLGTDIQSVQGGLGTNTPANMGYFTSRYQTPQTNSVVANLRAAAQAQALNEVLSNEQAIWKKRYQDAYKNYQKRQNARSYGGGGGGGNTAPTTDTTIEGGVDEVDTTSTVVGVVPGTPGGSTVANIIPDWDNMTSQVTGYTYVPYGQDGRVNYVYGSGGSSSNTPETTQRLAPVNRLEQNNPLPNWGKL